MLYWLTTCALTGYIAVFLQWKGLSNTEIGIVTGMGCILSVVVGPFVS
ncbi:MAG TPA: MFS transporter, partial [Erysipelotrichaceae bacterium]|nr:MFS transporter [Erysipelotrichaceae bacterium]HAV17825.1 MFS transporter [Erysipelotrichaceae bacterium]